MLQDERDKLANEVKRLREGGAKIPEEDLEELRYDNRRLQADLDNARKVSLTNASSVPSHSQIHRVFCVLPQHVLNFC